MSNSKETMTKKQQQQQQQQQQQDDLASTFNNLPWGLPLGFPSMPPFGGFPPFGLPTPNFPSLNSFAPSTGTTYPPPPPPLLSSTTSNDTNHPPTATTDVWSNGLATGGTGVDYNEYAKQLGYLMHAFTEQQQQQQQQQLQLQEAEKTKASPTLKHSKTKRSTPVGSSSAASPDVLNGKASSNESHARPTSASSSSTSSRRSSSNALTSKSSSSRSKPPPTTTSHSPSLASSSSVKTPTVGDPSMLDPLALAAAAAAAAASGGLTFPYFLPSLLSQSSSSTNPSTSGSNSGPNNPPNYPFSALSSSLMNPAAALYPFLSPDWFSSKLMDNYGNLPADKTTTDTKDSNSTTPKSSKQKHSVTDSKHLPTLNSLLNESAVKPKKRAKSIRTLTEEQEMNRGGEKVSPTNHARKSSSTNSNTSLLHSALTDPTNTNGLRENLLNLSRRSSGNETITPSTTRHTPVVQCADESRSADDDDSDLNPKRRKTDDVNEALVRIPLNQSWKRVTIVRAITKTGVRGDVSYYAPCGRKLRSFQEIDRYLAKKGITDLDRSHFTFSSKIHIGLFREPREGPDGKTIFQESNEDEIVNRILEINPKFRRLKCEYDTETPTRTSTVSSPCLTPSQNNNNGLNEHHLNPQQDIMQQMYEENRKLRFEQEEMAKRAAEIKNKREAMRLLRNVAGESSKSSTNTQYQHNDFLKAFIEQQKLVQQQQEHEHKKQLQQEQQEQERKRQELAYLKQMELKKRQEEKFLILEQRKAEKNAQREKKIQEKYMEIVLAKEMKKIVEDMQLRDLKPLPTLKPVENLRLSIEAFANSLMIIEFLNNFKHILNLPDNLIPTLNSIQQNLITPSASREINSLCQALLRIALDDPGIPHPKKGLTHLGQKLSEVDITEHTFSEILRLYIRERNGFDDKITQSLSDTAFQALSPDEKAEILAFLCNDLLTNKSVVEEIDRNLDELTGLRHEKWEMEKRLRRIKVEKYNSNSNLNGNMTNMKKMTTMMKEKDRDMLNSSDNESPDESEGESMRCDDETTGTNDPAAAAADDQDIETIDETKIDDLDKRLALVTRKYALIKRRVTEKQCRARALHLGQDRYRRRYWYFAHLGGVYIEGLTSGDKPPDEVQRCVENVTKQRLDPKSSLIAGDSTPIPTSSSSRSAQRKRQQQANRTAAIAVEEPVKPATPPPVTPKQEPNVAESESSENEEDDEEQQLPPPQLPLTVLPTPIVTNGSTTIESIPQTLNEIPSNDNNSDLATGNEDLATMDLTAFCMAAKRDNDAAAAVIDEQPPPPSLPSFSTSKDENVITNGSSSSIEQSLTTIKTEPNDDCQESTKKRDHSQILPTTNENNNTDDDNNLPLDLSCSKPKRSCQDDYWTSTNVTPPISHTYPLSTMNEFDQFQELNGLATAALLLNNIKQEHNSTGGGTPPKNMLDLTNANLHNLLSSQMMASFNLPAAAALKQESATASSMANFKQIEQVVREKIQFPQPLPIPDDVQSGWWQIHTPDELRTLIKSLAKRGQRERHLCRTLQRNFDTITMSMKSNPASNSTLDTPPPLITEGENELDDQLQPLPSFSDLTTENEPNHSGDGQEMDVLNEIYNLSDRIVNSSLQCRSYDVTTPRKRLTHTEILAKGSETLDEAKNLLTEIERNIERRYLKHPFVRKYELNLSSMSRISQHSSYHHTLSNSTNEITSSSSKYDEVPQQLERWRRTVNESRTPAQLALCLSQLDRCIAWEKSIMKVFCEICNSDVDEEKLLLCDGCDRGTHTYCFRPPMSFIPPNDWYCYVCIGKAKGDGLCFVCGNKGETILNRCEHCGKLFHEDCLKQAKQQRGKWLCVQCTGNESSSLSSSITGGNTNTKWGQTGGRQTVRSGNTAASSNASSSSTPKPTKARQPSTSSNTNGDSATISTASSSNNRNRSNANRGGSRTSLKSRNISSMNNEIPTLLDSLSNSSHADGTTTTTTCSLNESSSIQSPSANNEPLSTTNDTADLDDDIASPTLGKSNNRKSSKKSNSKPNDTDIKACRTILNELLKSDAAWPFQSPVDVKQHPEYYECIKNPMDFATMKKKMRNHQYTKRDEFFHDVQLILNNCEYYNEDDSPVGEAGHVLRAFFESRWAKQFG